MPYGILRSASSGQRIYLSVFAGKQGKIGNFRNLIQNGCKVAENDVYLYSVIDGTPAGGIAMVEATSCGGVVIFRGKILLLYKNYKNKYEGWVLPKGTVEEGEEFKDTAIREVKEETGVDAQIIKYVGKSQYTFNTPQNTVLKDVHWYLMMSDSYYSKPQREEFFMDSGYYKFHEAYHMLKFANEKQILEQAYNEYVDLKKSNLWGNKKYF